jgi:hypothetical protein
VDALVTTGDMDKAASAGGVSRRTITRWCAQGTDEAREFVEALDTARIRHKQLAKQPFVPREPPNIVVLEQPAEPAPPPIQPPSQPRLWTQGEYLEKLQEVADDPEHPATSTAWRLLGAWHIEAPVAAKRRLAERKADQDERDGEAKSFVVARLPAKVYESDDDVVEVEVVESDA